MFTLGGHDTYIQDPPGLAIAAITVGLQISSHSCD